MTEINPMLEKVKVDASKLHITLGVFNLEAPSRYNQMMSICVLRIDT